MVLFLIFSLISFCFCKVSETNLINPKRKPFFIFKDVVKNDHLGTAEDLQDRHEFIPLENSFDIFPYVKVSLIFAFKIFASKDGFEKHILSFTICWIQSSSYMTAQIFSCQVSWRFEITMHN